MYYVKCNMHLMKAKAIGYVGVRLRMTKHRDESYSTLYSNLSNLNKYTAN